MIKKLYENNAIQLTHEINFNNSIKNLKYFNCSTVLISLSGDSANILKPITRSSLPGEISIFVKFLHL